MSCPFAGPSVPLRRRLSPHGTGSCSDSPLPGPGSHRPAAGWPARVPCPCFLAFYRLSDPATGTFCFLSLRRLVLNGSSSLDQHPRPLAVRPRPAFQSLTSEQDPPERTPSLPWPCPAVSPVWTNVPLPHPRFRSSRVHLDGLPPRFLRQLVPTSHTPSPHSARTNEGLPRAELCLGAGPIAPDRQTPPPRDPT